MISQTLLYSCAAGILALQVGIVLVLIVRNAWIERSLARRASRSQLLAAMLHNLGEGKSPPLREELARRSTREDLRALEHWLDLVVERGEDPGWLPAEEYERTGLVEKHLQRLRSAKRWATRATSAEILGRTGSPRAVPQLLATALDLVGEPDAVRSVALRSLARIRHPDAVAPLVASLETSETWFAPTAAAVLARIGAPSVDPLRRELTDIDRPIASRRWAATILGDVGDRRALEALHIALADVDPELRARAAKSLGKLRDSSSAGPLLDRLLTDPSPFVRTSVAKALGRLPTREAIDFLTQSLSDPEWWVRLRAVESLASLGGAASDALRGALHDRDPIVAREAARGLEQLGVVAESIEALKDENYNPECAELLIQVGRAGSLDALFEALTRLEPNLVREIVRVLARVGNSAAGAPLASLLESTDDDALRARIVDALGRVGARGHVREVLPCLKAEHPWLRRTALEYLGRFASPAELESVKDLLSDAAPERRLAALRLSRRVRPSNVTDDDLQLLLDDVDPEVRAETAGVLAAAGRADVILKRPALFEDDRAVREIVRDLVPEGGVDTLRVVLEVVGRASDRDLERLSRVVQLASRANPDSALELFTTRIADPAARWALAVASLALPGPLPLSLEVLADDEDPRVRGAALPALLYCEVDSERAKARVIAATRDRSSLVVRGAVRALALVPDARLEAHFESVLRAGDPRPAAEAILALALRRSLVARHLEIAASIADTRVRLAAIVGRAFQGERDAALDWLAALHDDTILETLRRWRSEEPPLLGLLFGLARDPRAPLETRLLDAESAHDAEMLLVEELESNPAEDVRSLAVDGLQRLRSRRADGVLLAACLRDPSPRVRSAALGFLVERGGFLQQLGLLESALRDPEDSVRAAAAERTSMLEASVAIPLLVRHFGTSSPKCFDAITAALAVRAAADPASVLRAILGASETPRALLGLIAVVRRLAGPPSGEILDRVLRHRWAEIRGAGTRHLVARAGASAARLALDAACDPAAEVRLPAARLLGAKSISFDGLEPQRVAAVRRLLSDPSARVRCRAVLVAGVLGVDGARAELRRLAKDSDPRVARAAKRTLLRVDRRAKTAVTA